ncbi:UbiC transcription regulator-associated domain protein [Pseudoflavonifractor capillosus ATCC 29799]|uniref:UbiC transcription regulator-associated domain protein n=1 Tax=Pseudoflavonifractor capillosus ATCC 29799 TaxID=411467 RepID=A6NZD0_9FIRM|nr:UbiC transcription regulator-associated domain protein [Pseudoflavonifractor capillosus ATCC 29799]
MLRAVDKEKPIPLYYQIEESIRAQIESGELAPGEKLPTEQWYCSFFGVSRMTLRKALQDLINAGVIERSRGQGPTVAQPRLSQQLVRFSGLYDTLEAQGLHVTTRILSIGKKRAGALEASRLSVPEGTEILALRRLRFVHESPIALQHTCLRGDITGPIRSADLEDGSLYHLLEERGVCIERATQKFTACIPTKAQCRMFSLSEETPLLYTERTSFLKDETALEFSRCWYISSRFSMTVELKR